MMHERRRSALHEAGHLAAFLEGGLVPAFARLDRSGGFARCTLPADFGISEAEIVGSLAGFYTEVFADPAHRALATKRASDDLANFRSMVSAKHRGRELGRHARRYRAKARRLVERRFSEIYALARELEARGRVGYELADAVVTAVNEVRRRRENKRS